MKPLLPRPSHPLITALLFMASASLGFGALHLPAVISDHAVLQVGKPVPIWGWAGPGEIVTVTFQSKTGPLGQFETKAGDDGRWSGQLPALPSGATGELDIRTENGEMLRVADVLAGEVWLCSGQSNMSYILNTTTRGPPENTPPEMLAEAKQDAAESQGTIRYFAVQEARADVPMDDVTGRWIVATPDAVSSNYSWGDALKNTNDYMPPPPGTPPACSSVAWHFAVALRHKLHCPVGVISSSVGGTSVELWSSRPEFDACPDGPVEEKGCKPGNPNQIGCLYNAMIHGVEPYGIRGFLWFQGDANEGNWPIYGDLIRTLITAWRNHWHDPTLPFYYVEMNNYGIPQQAPVEYNNLSLIREAQQGALQLSNTGVAATIDLGVIAPPGKFAAAHFPNKQPLGQHLANMALNDIYGQPGLVRSPQLKSFAVEGDKIRLKFDYADGLRVRGGGDLKGFALQAANGAWVWAQGKIDGQDILLWSDQVPVPANARYAWAMNPVISVENEAGLPLRPFRTDTASKDVVPPIKP